ncbi:hypothetical protein L484_005463 [Morus notabilis]|uniref:Uncharacterized protein n=1 Tax=Morus notabilis TaxID=981085 RepID=W9RSL3_9ROSA|nr:hypothetical protein L484_005463 [Morus notabilis]
MDSKGPEENGKGPGQDGLRSRSFRDEDYNTRRVFLRSYPLRWGGEEERNEEELPKKMESKNNTRKKYIKKVILAVIEWSSDKALVLRKVKNKIAVYVVACIPISFKPPTALISA